MGKLETKLSDLEQRVDTVRDHASAHLDARIEAEVGKHFVAGGPLSAAIDEGWQRRRADDRLYVASLIDVVMSQLETKLADLEKRLVSHPGHLPMARVFVVGRVNYRGDIVVRDGSTYQARVDTASSPPHSDWVCLAQGGANGRDAISMKMRGAFDNEARYTALDVVTFENSTYAARHDDPGPIFGGGWQALAVRGKTGDKGPSGPRGERGDKGERGEIGLVGPPGPRGEKGERGLAGLQGERGQRGERGEAGPVGPIGLRGEKGERGTSGRDGIAGARGERGEKGDVGPSGERGAEGPPGRLSVVKIFEPGMVFYQGDVVTHGGSLYQAVRDTGRDIPHADWICLARAGRDASSLTIRGTYDAYEAYQRLDVVAFDGMSFIAKRDDPGLCPGDGWQLIAAHGGRGDKGLRGPRGERGDKGERGEPAPTIVAWLIDRERYRASPRMSDGTVGPMLELRGLFEQFLSETRD